MRMAGQDVVLAKPETFMNLSGLSVRRSGDRSWTPISAEDLIVIYDELDLPLGTLRIRERGSSGRAQRSEVRSPERWERKSGCGSGSESAPERWSGGRGLRGAARIIC